MVSDVRECSLDALAMKELQRSSNDSVLTKIRERPFTLILSGSNPPPAEIRFYIGELHKLHESRSGLLTELENSSVRI
jgi:hypothetical protein